MRKKEREITERLAAGIVTGSLLLCILISFLGFQENRRMTADAARKAAQAAAGVQPGSGGAGNGSFAEYEQLSDPLLVLVNGAVAVPEDWVVTPRMIHDEQVDLRIYRDLTAMFDAAERENVWFWVASGYRSAAEQEIVLDRAVEVNRKAGMEEAAARKEALRTVALPGHSEHHTGLAVDLNDVSDHFESTEAYRWLCEHAAEYGFIQRYREEKTAITGFDKESWHYRYVGKKHAKEMERLDLCLEEYVLYLQMQGIR